MKKVMKLICLLLAAISTISVSLVGCGGGNSGTTTTLQVWNYDGGVGHAWLDAAIERFETLKANESYQDGKLGVTIKVLNTTDTTQLSTMNIANHSVYFAQGIRYNGMQANGSLLDISDIVKATIPGESVSIESKLSENTKKALTANDKGSYYVLPHYQSFNGVVYNKTLFDEKGFYFAKDPANYASNETKYSSYGFIKKALKDDVSLRTLGPDGVAGTDDDGLPSSVEEFERLCEYMIDSSVTPFIWKDGTNKSYQMALTNALWMNLEGYDGVMANFTFNSNGAKTKIVTSFNADGTPNSKEVEITEENIWEIYQQESRYYALKMSEKVFGDSRYCHKYADEGQSHTFIQKTFFESMYISDPIGMMLEGSYWENEAKASGEYDEALLKNPDAVNQEIRMMPLPVKATGSVTSAEEGRKPVHLDMLSAYAFINANVREKHGASVEKLAKDFLQFCYTDASLAEFTVKSSVTKDVNYTITSDQYNSLSSFSKSVWDAKKEDSVVVPISDKAEFTKNPSEFTMYSDLVIWKSSEYTYPVIAFSGKNKVSAKDYFLGMQKGKTWWDGLNH